jgi:aryl-alcohol dehydrogenase-like predicted oxidoreductase
MHRRKFLKTVATTGIGAFASLQLASYGKKTQAKSEIDKVIPKRPFGKTGEKLSIIGLGGVAVMKREQADVNNIVHEAFDRGVNYVDVAPTYGNAEALLEPALKGYRDKIFLACKTQKRKREEAAAELRQSLKNLATDHFDLYQFHAISNMEDVETIFGGGGAIEAFEEARKEGLIRYIGFSAHSAKAALAAMDRFDFDSILFPINFALYYRENFGPQVVKKAEEKGVARLAIKAMANSRWGKDADRSKFPNCWYQPVSDPVLADMALRFTLSQPITAAVPPGDPKLFRMAMDIAAQFTSITDEEKEGLKKIALNQTEESIFKLDA